MIRELQDVDRHRSALLGPTGETLAEFLARATCALRIREFVTMLEERQALSALEAPNASFPQLEHFHAQAVLFKACLELGRLRPQPPYGVYGVSPGGLVLTVDQLVSLPLETPLPKAFVEPSPLERTLMRDRARATVEYHLAASQKLAVFDYHRAVQAVGRRYLDLRVAFDSLRHGAQVSDAEHIFIQQYESWSERIG
jgi:hypothetical protein